MPEWQYDSLNTKQKSKKHFGNGNGTIVRPGLTFQLFFFVARTGFPLLGRALFALALTLTRFLKAFGIDVAVAVSIFLISNQETSKMSTAYHVPREFAMGGSYVDETLFGESRAKKTANRRRAAAKAGQGIVGQSQQQQVFKLDRNEYEAIKRRANTPLAVFRNTEQPREKRTHRVPISHLKAEKPTPAQVYEKQYRETVGAGGELVSRVLFRCLVGGLVVADIVACLVACF